MDGPVSLTVDVTMEAPESRMVRIAGELDMATTDQVTEALDGVISLPGRTEVVIDLADLCFIDAAGVTALIHARRLADRRGVRLRARNARGAVDLVLRVTDVADLLHLPQVPSDVPLPAANEKLTE